MLTGTLVRLRALTLTDYSTLMVWLNDPGIMVFWGMPGNTESLSDIARREEEQANRGNSRKYMIESLEGMVIGQIDYYELNWQARSAWVSIMVGEREYWGGGFGTDAMRVLLDYLFSQLNLNRVSLTAHESNERAIRSYRKNGFVVEGTLREWAYFNGEWVNGVLMSVLKSDFLATGSTP